MSNLTYICLPLRDTNCQSIPSWYAIQRLPSSFSVIYNFASLGILSYVSSNFLASIGDVSDNGNNERPIPSLRVRFTIGSKKFAQLVVNDTYDSMFAALKSFSFAGVSKNWSTDFTVIERIVELYTKG